MSKTDYCTPKKPTQQLMNKIKIPASPYMKKIGFGTGVAVYELERSPAFNKLRSPWAIKKLLTRKQDDHSIQHRLRFEAYVLRKLVHPNIVGFRAFVENKNGNILAMEECSYCLGNLIEARAEEGKGPFDAKTVTKVSLDIASALSYLHNIALFMHCDLKSYNVLVQGDFEVCKLCDFGVSIPVTKEGTMDVLNAPGVEFTGTKAWCAPEVLRYPQDITTKADIYSFGLIIWEMIALLPPFSEDFIEDFSDYLDVEKEKLDELLEKITSRKRQPIPADIDLGEEYNPILEIYYCCTCEDKKDRPPAVDLAVILNDIFNKN